MAGMVIARSPQHSERAHRISMALEHAGITHECRSYTVDQPRSRAHGKPYTMIVVPCGTGSRAMEAWDIAAKVR